MKLPSLPRLLGIGTRGARHGKIPGSLIHLGEKKLEKVRIRTICYGPNHLSEAEPESVAEAIESVSEQAVTWINVDGLHDVDQVAAVGQKLGVHSLVLEDILNTGHRPKAEDYGDYLFVTLKMLQWRSDTRSLEMEQVSLLLGDGWVVTFQERSGDVFEAVRGRLRGARGRIRKSGCDYLAYALLDAVVDNYFVVLEQLGEAIEDIEERVLAGPSDESLQRLHFWKREVIRLRRAVWPLRELVGILERGESERISPSVRPFLRDLYDHAVQVMDTVENVRDLLSGLLDLQLNLISTRMNEVMKVLTIIATIFIPITFVAGIYGMNFEYMPELKWPWGYFGALGIMGTIALIMLVYFKRKDWL